MGKGNRNSQKKAQNMAENPEMYLEKKKTEGKKSRTDKAIAIVCVVLALIIAATLVISILSRTGVFARMTTAVETENVEINSAMMSYFLYESIINWYSQYSYYVSMLGVDFSQDLRTQPYTYSSIMGYLGMADVGDLDRDGKVTWYDYFISEPVSIIVYANAAKANNIELSDADKAEIDAYVDNLKTSLKLNGYSISDQYGQGVGASDIRNCLELSYLAEDYITLLQDQKETSLEKDDAALREYVNENKEEFYSADCLKYTVNLSSKNFKNDTEYDKKVTQEQEFAKHLLSATTPEQFIEMVKNKADFIKDLAGTDTTESDTETETETETKAETATKTEAETGEKKEETTKLPSGMAEVEINYSTETDELNDWLFGDTWAEENEVTYFEESGTVTEKETTSSKKETAEKETSKETEKETEKATEAGAPSAQAEEETTSGTASIDKKEPLVKTYNTYKVEVYFVLDACDTDHEYTHNFGYVMVGDQKVAEEIRAEFLKGETTLENFYNLAEKKHKALHPEENHSHSADTDKFSFEKVEEMTAGVFNRAFGSSYKAVDTWLEDASRKAGDTSEIITVTETSGSGDSMKTTKTYFVVFFDKENATEKGETWYVNAFDATVNYQIEEWFNGQIASGKVTLNSDVIVGIINSILQN